MFIRPLIEADIPTCAQIVTTAPVWQRYGLTFERATQQFSEALRTNAPILVADDGNANVIGFVRVIMRGAFDLSPYIRWLAVASTQRSRGVGQQLLSAAEALVQPPARDIFLLCADFNIDAQRFYETNGYTRVGAIPDYAVRGVTEYIYRKRMFPPPES